MEARSSERRKRQGPCASCLWWWDLYATGERMCYCNASPYYHKAMVSGCANYENLTRVRRNVNLGNYADNAKEGNG